MIPYIVTPAAMNPMPVIIAYTVTFITFFQCHLSYLLVLAYSNAGIINPTTLEHIPPINLIYPDICEYNTLTVQQIINTINVTITFFLFVISVLPHTILNIVILNDV